LQPKQAPAEALQTRAAAVDQNPVVEAQNPVKLAQAEDQTQAARPSEAVAAVPRSAQMISAQAEERALPASSHVWPTQALSQPACPKIRARRPRRFAAMATPQERYRKSLLVVGRN